MLRFEDLAPFIEQRPAAQLAQRVAPHYPGHVAAVLPPEWLRPLGDRHGVIAAGRASDAPARTSA